MERRKWIALMAGLVMPGLGQVYNGELLKGACFFTMFIVFNISGMYLSTRLPDPLLLPGVSLTVVLLLSFYLFTVVEAFRASIRPELAGIRKPYGKWYFYTAVWMMGSLVVMTLVQMYVKTSVITAYKIPTESMQPEVWRGDCLLVDNTAYNRVPPRVGDIVVFVFPDDRSKVYIRRIKGLPGDRIAEEEGTLVTVPHGTAYVLGDNRAKSQDSRLFGPIPLRDILGKARQVYFSSGPTGVRWDRIGRVVNSNNVSPSSR